MIKLLVSNKDEINDEDVLLLHGGGNIGDTYMVPEEGRRFIIQTKSQITSLYKGLCDKLMHKIYEQLI